MGKSTAFFSSYLSPYAFADTVDVIDATTSGRAFVARHALGLVFGDILVSVVGTIVGVAGHGVEQLAALRNWLIMGTVKCAGGAYAALGFDEGLSLAELWSEEVPRTGHATATDMCSTKNPDFLDTMMEGHITDLCKVTVVGMSYFTNSFETRRRQYFLKNATVAKFLGQPPPACTEASAKLITSKMKDQLIAEIDSIKKGNPSDALEKGGIVK